MGLKMMKEKFGDCIMKTGCTTMDGKVYFSDIMLFAWMIGTVKNPKWGDRLKGVLADGGHTEWVNCFWEKHSPMFKSKDGLCDRVKAALCKDGGVTGMPPPMTA